MKNARGQIEHVFVRDPDSGLSIDVRGAMPVEDMAKGSALEHAQHHFTQVDGDEVRATFGTPTPTDLREARKTIKDHLSRVLEKVQQVAPDDSLEISQ